MKTAKPQSKPAIPSIRITSDKPVGRTATRSRYEDLFRQLTPEANCLVFDDWKACNRVAQALETWSRRHIHKDCRVISTKAYPADGKPRCWLAYPAAALPPATVHRGHWPKKAST